MNVCFEGVEGESLLLLLDAKGIAASSGSACTSGSLDPSHVLLALGRPHEVAHGSLRLSLSEYNTPEAVSYTHLDVYKRQPWRRWSRRDLRSRCWTSRRTAW